VFLRNETRAKSGFVSYVSISLCFDFDPTYGRVHIRNSSCGRVHIASNQNGGCILNGLTIRRVQFVLEINIEGCQSGV